MSKSSTMGRVKARRSAVQALYQQYMSGSNMTDIIHEFREERSETKKSDIEYFETLLRGIINQQDNIEQAYTDLLDRSLDDIGTVERAILNLGVYELLHHPDIPWRVVINESVELAKMFGAEDSHKYINSIMDKAAHNIRNLEIDNEPSVQSP